MPTYRGVLIDLDGTLIDSNDAHARAWQAALHDYGYTVEFQTIRERIGEGGDHLMPEVSGIDADSETGKALAQRRRELFEQNELPHISAFAQVRGLLERLQAEGYQLALATSSSQTPRAKAAGLVPQPEGWAP